MQQAMGSGVCLDPPEQEQLRAMIARHGEAQLARTCGVSSWSITRVLAGLPVRRSTARVVREAIAEEYQK